MAHVDVELECDRELIVHQPGGDEHALRIAQLDIAMADGVVAEGNVVAVGDHGVVALVHRERHKVISLALQSSGSGVGDGGDHSFQIRGGHGDLAGDGITDSIGRLRDGSLADDLVRRTRNRGCSLRHSKYSSALTKRDSACGSMGSLSPRCGVTISSHAAKQKPGQQTSLVLDSCADFAGDFPVDAAFFRREPAAWHPGTRDHGTFRGVHPNMTIAYRYIALPVAAVVGVVVLILASTIEVRHYRQTKALEEIERTSC